MVWICILSLENSWTLSPTWPVIYTANDLMTPEGTKLISLPASCHLQRGRWTGSRVDLPEAKFWDLILEETPMMTSGFNNEQWEFTMENGIYTYIYIGIIGLVSNVHWKPWIWFDHEDHGGLKNPWAYRTLGRGESKNNSWDMLT